VFHHEVEGELGTMFFDLHSLDGKFLHAAHFTIRCGRIRTDEDGDDKGGGVGGRDDGTRGKDDHQLLIVAPVCSLSPSQSSASVPTQMLLSHSEVETLYHEVGRKLHSLLSRTSFQHLSGTRAWMDFVETPSHLFESFARDPRQLPFAYWRGTTSPAVVTWRCPTSTFVAWRYRRR
jgi:intermediate peptidase